MNVCFQVSALKVRLIIVVEIPAFVFIFTLVPCIKYDFPLETPTLTHETFKALKPGLSAYADDVEKVTVFSHVCLLITFVFCSLIKVIPSQMQCGSPRAASLLC